MTARTADIAIIGGGIAGLSLAAQLAWRTSQLALRIMVLEAEAHPGTQASGRSAANWEPAFGPPLIRALTRASGPFLHHPPVGFTAAPLVARRPILMGATAAEARLLPGLFALGYQECSRAEAIAMLPALRHAGFAAFLLDTVNADVDVDLVLQGFLRALKGSGGQLICKARVTAGQRLDGVWQLSTTAGPVAAAVVVDAAGAWADQVAQSLGVAPAGLVAKRRSAAIVTGIGLDDCAGWPQFAPVSDTFYAKPMGGKLMISPADADAMEPHDAWADDYKLAEAIEAMSGMLHVTVTRMERSWGGLRTFAPDGLPVVGFEPNADGFFWLAGQGGYGIQTAPALSDLAAALLMHEAVPAYVVEAGVDACLLAPRR